MISLTRRLALGLLLAGLVIMFLLAHGSVVLFDHALREYLGNQLKSEAESIASSAINQNGQMDFDALADITPFNQVYSGHYFLLKVDDNKQIRSRSLWDTSLPHTSRGLLDTLMKGPEQQQLLVWRGTFSQNGHHFDVTTAIDYTRMNESLSWLRLSIWLLGGLLAVLLVIIQQHVIRLVLTPLKQVRAELELLNDGHRMKIETQVPIEIEPVVSELNHQLERIERVLSRSKDGISNLGHALKTPIAVMEAILARPELQKLPELRDNLSSQLANIHRLVQCELQRARLDSRESSHKARFQVDTEIPPLIATLGEIYPHIHFSFELNDQTLIIPWEGEDILEILGNLLDNAGKWASTQARLAITEDAGWVYLVVEDDGPGIAPDMHARVLNRGTRLDEQVSGHGLGMSIIEQVVNFLNGRLELGKSELGGLQATVALPLRHGS